MEIKHFWKTVPGWFQHLKTFDLILNEIPDNNFIFVEIGTFMGRSLSYFTVESIIRNKIGKIYSVDTFSGSQEHLDSNSPFFIPELVKDKDFLYNEYTRYTSSIKRYINTIRKQSTDAALDFENNSIDAIYLDAAHDYNSVSQDLESWYPKLKNEKVLLFGDDWTWTTVRKAVTDFATNKKLQIYITEPNEYLVTNEKIHTLARA